MRSFVIDLVIKHYPKAVVYQLEVPVEVAEQRLSSRGHELGTRLEQYESELNLGRQYAKRVFVSDGVTDVYKKVLKAIEADFNNTLN